MKKKRAPSRKFSDEEKQRIVAEANLCKTREAMGNLLRRENVQSWQIKIWRGELMPDFREELEKLRCENFHLKEQLKLNNDYIKAQAKIIGMLDDD